MIDTHPRLFRLIIILIVLLAVACAWWFPLPMHAAPDPGLQARWSSSISAVVSWHQESRACLWRNQTFVHCYDAPGEYRVMLGGPLTDGTLRPAAKDVFMLAIGDAAWHTELRGVVYFPLVG